MSPLRSASVRLAACLALAAVACSAQTDAPDDEAEVEEENAVKVDTRSAAARAQYDANVAFALAYRATCKATTTGKKRALVTGFGRFQGIADNATGRMVAGLVPGLAYPETAQPAPGAVDPPGAQLAVARGTITLPTSGEVEVCAMILPVYWDLAAILVSKEIESFGPDFVLMNGVAGSRQDVWLELGSVNRAAALDDGSDQLRPMPAAGAGTAPILESAAADQQARPNLLAWEKVATAARASRDAMATRADGELPFGEVVRGVKLAGYPRASNTYLCNNLTYITGYLMDNPGRVVQLLRASTRVVGKPSYVRAGITRDLRRTPRVFAHWPSDLASRHTGAGRDVLRTILDAQLSSLDAATRGDNRDAAPDLPGGRTF